jgi:hypothetical protein
MLMSFTRTLKGVVIAFVGAVLIVGSLSMIAMPTFVEWYFPWFTGIRPYSLPLGIVMIVLGLVLLIYGQKMAGIR